MNSKNYIAYGYDVTDETIKRNGKEELFVNKDSRFDAIKSWEYTHTLHQGHAYTNSRGVGYCPKCGEFAIVKVNMI